MPLQEVKDVHSLLNMPRGFYTGFMSDETSLTSSHVVIVIAQALTGLGHLRVSHALYHGLPRDAHALLLSSTDQNINVMHRITSVNPLMLRLMEITQYGWAQDAFLWFALRYLKNNAHILEAQLQSMFDEQVIRPRILVVVATLTSVGHQIAYIKERFEKKNNVKIVMMSVVTDDSPQHIWAIGGSDIIFVPSHYTKRQLELYHHSQRNLKPAAYEVLPYFVSPTLSVDLSTVQFKRRKDGLNPDRIAPIHVSIPVSGAAVQLSFVGDIIHFLEERSDRFVFHVTSLHSPMTAGFLATLIGKVNVRLHVSTSHRQVIEFYEKAYEQDVMSLEVTKPSEQSFKALLRPHQRGGSVLFFSHPVGRQEWDNIKFMIRHNLLPTAKEQQKLWKYASSGSIPDETMYLRARMWRALRLPPLPKDCARFIWWAFEHKLLLSMNQYVAHENTDEVSGDGVVRFWKRVSDYIKNIQ